jgi:hypothetical protein
MSERAATELGPSASISSATFLERGPRYRAPTSTETIHSSIEIEIQGWPNPQRCAVMISPATNSRIDAGRKTRRPTNSTWRPSLGRSFGSVERWLRMANTWMTNAPPTQTIALRTWMKTMSSYTVALHRSAPVAPRSRIRAPRRPMGPARRV